MNSRAAWLRLDGVTVLGANQFQEFKTDGNHFVVGVMGFAGSFDHAGFAGADLQQWVGRMTAVLKKTFLDMVETHGTFVMVSGGTNSGVLEIAYALSKELQLISVAVAPNQVLEYPLADFDLAVPFGNRFGDESDLFVSLCDAFILIGGGEQSRRETLAADAQQKEVVVIQGFGGVADEFSATDLKHSTFVAGFESI